jgi:purine-binding chemotaxis protein CheW
VLDIVSVETNQIQPVPRTAQGASSDFLAGLVTIDATMIALIDLNNLVPSAVANAA